MGNGFYDWNAPRTIGPPSPSPTSGTPGTPGKGKSLPKTTADLPAKTASDAITKGDFCKNDGAGGDRCGLLSEDARAEMIAETRDRLGDWLQNLHSAVAGARIEVATETEEGTSWLADMLFEMIAGGVMPGIVGLAVTAAGNFARTLAMRGASDVRARIAAGVGFAHKFEAHKDQIEDILKEGASPIADRIKENTLGAHGDAKKGKDLFLQGIASKATEVKQGISENVPRLDDVDLSCLYDAYAIKNHSVGRYANFIEGLLGRYDKNRIGEIGKVGDGAGRVRRAIKLRAYGTEKTALVEQYQGENAFKNGRPRFVQWIDGDFAALAQARTNATDAVNFGPRKGMDGSDVAPTGVDTLIDVTSGWDDLDPDGNLELQAWVVDCRDVKAAPDARAWQVSPIDDKVDEEKNFVSADDGGGGGE